MDHDYYHPLDGEYETPGLYITREITGTNR